jgi:hypothetical protein
MKQAIVGEATITWKIPSPTSVATRLNSWLQKKKDRMEPKESAEKQGERKGGETQISPEGYGRRGLCEGSGENLERT